MINLIVAFDANQLIGKDNVMPWHYPEDLKYFKEVTLNQKVLMGRKTYESILTYLNKPLPNRHNIVVTTDSKFDPVFDVEVIHDLESFLQASIASCEEIFVIGGRTIYEATLPYANRLYITHIDKEYQGNVYFPKIDYSKFQLIKEQCTNELRFCVYERVK